MRVLLVHSGNAVGGDSNKYTFVKEQGDALQKQGCEVYYYAIVGKGINGYLSNIKPLKQKIKELNPDIIHAHYGLCGIVSLLARYNTPVVITFHNGETLNWKINLICSLFVRRAEYVIYVAQHIYDKCFVKAKRFDIIPCGVSLDDLRVVPYDVAKNVLGWSCSKKYILFGGSISNPRKNYKLLDESIKTIDRQDIEVIEMKGFTRQECVLRMCACDCFCLPSLSEGSPQALKEAMACGCPIVATDIADIKHLLGDLPGHYICSFEPEDVAKKIKLALDFKGRTNGRKRIIELGLTNEQVAKKIISIYNQVLEKLHE